MYKPKSPTASSKSMNFSPSPKNNKKLNYTKHHGQQQNISIKQRASFGVNYEQKVDKKVPLTKKSTLKNIQVDVLISQQTKAKDLVNNQTPKFCVKIQASTPVINGIKVNPLGPNNYFSFGQKQLQKIKTQRKKQCTNKQLSKSPKQVKRKIGISQYGAKNRLQEKATQVNSISRTKRSNQPYIR